MADTTIAHDDPRQQQDQSWEEECYQIVCETARDQAHAQLTAVEERLDNQRPSGWKLEGWRACFERGEQVYDGDRGVKVLYTEADGVRVPGTSKVTDQKPSTRPVASGHYACSHRTPC